MLAEQARLRELMIQALQSLAAHHAEQSHLAQGISYIRRLLSLEPWREEAHRQLMLLLAQAGQRSAALAQYEVCRQALAEGLGVEPGPETVALYKRIRAGELSRREMIISLARIPCGSVSEASSGASLPSSTFHNLPTPTLPLCWSSGRIGRHPPPSHRSRLPLINPGWPRRYWQNPFSPSGSPNFY